MRRHLKRIAMAAAAAMLLAGCGQMKAEDFEGKEPTLRLEAFFAGHSRAYGLFEDRFGNVRRQFVVDIEGRWDGKTLTLIEDFRYDDGETERRIWTIRPVGDHGYEGEADGVIGVASGAAHGNAVNWRYDFDLAVGGRSWRVHFDDWMFLQPDGILLNKARVSKWGVTVGEATIAFRKLDRTDEEASGGGARKAAIARLQVAE